MNTQTTQESYEKIPAYKRIALVGVGTASFVVSLMQSSISIAVPVIALDLQASAILISWLPTAYLLGNVVLLLPGGKLADIYGRKRIFLIGMTIFTLSCLLANIVPNIELLLLTRLLQGMGGALIFATIMAIVTSVFTTKNRGVALGITSGALYVGMSCGPIVGGYFTETFGWRSVFLFPIPLALLTIALFMFIIKGDWKNEQPQRVDWFGSLIFLIWSSALFIGVSNITNPNSYALLVFGAICLVYFFYQQARSDSPLIRFKAIMDNRMFSHSLLASMCAYASNFPMFFLFSLYLQFIQGMSPTDAGKIIVLKAVMMAVFAPLAGKLSDLFEPRIIATTGCLIMACVYGYLQSVDTDTSIYLIGIAFMLLGIGIGIFTSPNNNAAMSSVENSKLGIASAVLNLARVTGSILGTAIMLLLVSVIIGEAQIKPEQSLELLAVIRWSLSASCLLAILGAYFSYVRGFVHNR